MRLLFVIGVVAALGLSCGGEGGESVTELDGVVWLGGPVAGAEVTAYQLVEGERTLTLGNTTTSDTGAWHLSLGIAYEHIELEAQGGSYTEVTGGTVVLDAATTLSGVALDVAQGEHRLDVPVSPWSQLVLALAHARHDAGKEPTFNESIAKAHALMAEHFGFDPTQGPIANLGTLAASPTEAVKHALALAGLSELAQVIATEASLTAQDINTGTALRTLTSDAASAEALFDGNADTLTIGSSCALPDGCVARGANCYNECTVYANTLRSWLAQRIGSFLQRSENGTGLEREDVQSWLEHLASNDPRDADDAPELFGGDPEPLDIGGPVITWVAPAGGEVVSGDVTISVTAVDALGVASLTVEIMDASATSVTDVDDAADVFAGSINTGSFGDGSLTLRASATDDEGNTSTADVTVTVDNVDGGTLSGAVFKGPIDGATIEVYRYVDGIKGTRLDSGTSLTAADGTFTNVALANGYSGPILIEAGGTGTYDEEAAPSTTVSLDVGDKLRTVVADYNDGQALANIVVSPVTSFATTYYEYLRTQVSGTFAEVWTSARAAMESHFGVPDVLGLYPQTPAQMTVFSSAARYGLILVGLSRTAWEASAQGGGDGGTFGSAMTAVRVWRVLDQDLADGCWNGRAGATQLYFGGSQALDADSTRKHLADAIVSYLSSPQDETPFDDGAADVLALLETLSQSGPTSGAGTSCEAGQLFPTPGQHYDQLPPELVWESTPAANALVRQTIHVRAVGTDNLTAPTVTWDAPAGLVDDDTNAHIVDSQLTTAPFGDGPLTVTATATDDSENTTTISRNFTIDNTAPTLAWPSSGFLVDDGPPVVWWTTDRGAVLSGTTTDAHPGTVVAIIGANSYAGSISGGTWTVDLPATALPTSPTDVTIRVADGAGNQVSLTKKLAGDDTAPVVTVAANSDTTVNDERNDVITFDAAHRPSHTHVASSTDDAILGGTGCPDVYKFVYFLDENAPAFVTEVGDPNPIHWEFSVTDNGVGIDAAATQYRVLRDDTGAILVNWTALAGTTTSSGADYAFSLFRRDAVGSSVIPALGTYEGAINVEMRGEDRFGRLTTATRCFTQHPLAPATQLEVLANATDHTAAGMWALRLLTLASNDPISSQVLNATAPGAGILELGVWQASGEPAYLNLSLTVPTTAAQRTKGTQVTWAHTATASGAYECGFVDDGPSADDECKPIASNPLPDPGTDVPATDSASLSATYQLRVFRDVAGVWTEQSPCGGCAASEYLMPASTGTAVHFVAIVVIDDIGDDFTLATGATGTAPYSEVSLLYSGGSASTTITGKLETTNHRCGSNLQVVGSGANQRYQCPANQVRTYRQYRMLKSASITFPADDFVVKPTTAPTASLAPLDLQPLHPAGDYSRFASTWTTTESPIPAPLTTP